MKYKVGDVVKVKSIDWYNENKNDHNIVEFNCNLSIYFIESMAEWCGQKIKISEVHEKEITMGTPYYRIKEDCFCCWVDEMFEDPKPNQNKKIKTIFLGI